MRRAVRWPFVVAAILVFAACGGESTTGEPAAPDDAAGPFILEGLPVDFVPQAAGEGGVEQDWGTDWGSDSPFVVIRQGDRRVKVDATGFQHEGEVAGSAQLAGTGATRDEWTISGRVVGDDIALRATSRDADPSELDRLLDGVVAEGRRAAPSVEDLPDGWEVVGGSDADIVMSIGRGLAPSGGYGATWVRGDPDDHRAPRLTAVTLAGDAADLAAWVGDLARPVNWFGDAHGELLEVEGREAAFVVLDEWEGGPNHVLLSRLEDGSLLVLTSSGDERLSREQLVALAASARPATEQEWDELGWSTWGGPDLHADDAHVELARGVEDGQEWLLQATRTPPPDSYAEAEPPAAWFVDPCLKLIGGQRVCATSGTGDVLIHQASGSIEFPDFYLVRTDQPGAAARVTTRNGSATGPLIDLPDGSPSVAVVFADAAGGIPGCSEFPIPPELENELTFEVPEVDIVDADGAFVGCAASMLAQP